MSSHEINDLLDENTELRQENSRLREALVEILNEVREALEEILNEDIIFYPTQRIRTIVREVLKGGEE
jgi:hypothetical protein